MPLPAYGTWQISDDQVSSAIKSALDAGYRHFDCAYIYGNEEAIGSAFQQVFQSGKVLNEFSVYSI